MDEIKTLKKLQSTGLEILLVIDDFCKRNGIEWFLDSGTALGAIRHKGFIPWDDDIDIGMARPDYDRFLELGANGLGGGYSIHTSVNTPGFTSTFAKVYKDGTKYYTKETMAAQCDQGIFVDVFPYDYLAADQKKAFSQRRRARAWQSMMYLKYLPFVQVPHTGFLGAAERVFFHYAHYVVGPLFSERFIQRQFEKSRLSPRDKASDILISLPWPMYDGFPEDVLFPTSQLEFENHVFPAPHDPDRFLQLLYGDWTVLPSPEERHTHLPLLLDFGDGDTWQAE